MTVSSRRYHLGALAPLGVIFAAAAILGFDGRHQGLQFGGYVIPELCGLKLVSGRPCPGCGLTRSIVSLVHGDVADSVHWHPLAIPFLLWLVFYSGVGVLGRDHPRHAQLDRSAGMVGKGIFVAFLVLGVYRLIAPPSWL